MILNMNARQFFFLMTWIVFTFMACLMGGLMNRIRGGWRPFNNSIDLGKFHNLHLQIDTIHFIQLYSEPF